MFFCAQSQLKDNKLKNWKLNFPFIMEKLFNQKLLFQLHHTESFFLYLESHDITGRKGKKSIYKVHLSCLSIIQISFNIFTGPHNGSLYNSKLNFLSIL